LGYMWVDRGVNVDAAFALLKRAHLLAPQDGAISDSVGWAYFKQGDYVNALKYLEMASEQDAENPEIYDHLADTYAKLGKEREALKFWQLALELLDKGAEPPRADFRQAVEDKVEDAQEAE
jgi:tetratricopeptide (TPR) repeat protein